MNLRKLNPFRGLPNAREVWAWGMYDLANQSFTLLIITLLFSLYFKQVVVGEEGRGDALWGAVYGGSMLLVVASSVLLGALADAKGWRKQMLLGTGIGCVVLTCSLALTGPSTVVLAAALFVCGNLMYQLGENFLASFLPDVSTSRNIGKISAIGWTMGYVGALLLLLITVGSMLVFGRQETEEWRPYFVFAGLWFLMGMIPAALLLRNDPARERMPGSLLKDSFGRVWTTAHQVRRYRHLALFLTGFFVYGFGIQVVVAFASILAADFGFSGLQLVLFVLQLTVTAGLSAAVTGLFQDRIGAKTTILVFLGVWIVSTLALLGIAMWEGAPEWSLWVIGNGIGFGLGGLGTAGRAMVGRCTPRHRAAEFFGLWGMTYKLAGAIGVLSFGLVKEGLGNVGALALLAGFFVVGAAIVAFVNERAGVLSARQAEREYRAGLPVRGGSGVLPPTMGA